MLRYDGRRTDEALPPRTRLLDAALSALNFTDEISTALEAVWALAGEARDVELSASVIREAGRDAWADEVLVRAQVVLDEGAERVFTRLPTLRFDGRRMESAAAEPRRLLNRDATAAEGPTQHRARSRSRGYANASRRDRADEDSA